MIESHAIAPDARASYDWIATAKWYGAKVYRDPQANGWRCEGPLGTFELGRTPGQAAQAFCLRYGL